METKYLLQFFYKGTAIIYRFTFEPVDFETTHDGYRIVDVEIAQMLKNSPTNGKMIEYEVGYHGGDPVGALGPLSGATFSEIQRAVEVLYNFYQVYRTQKDKNIIRRHIETDFKQSDSRVRNTVLLLSKLFGNQILYYIWAEYTANSLIGLKKNHVAQQLGIKI